MIKDSVLLGPDTLIKGPTMRKTIFNQMEFIDPRYPGEPLGYVNYKKSELVNQLYLIIHKNDRLFKKLISSRGKHPQIFLV